MMTTTLHLDHSEKKIVAEKVQDVEPILENNKTLQTMEQRSDWGRHVASVPDVIVVKWLNEEYARGNVHLRYLGPGFSEWFAEKIKDPDNRAWRTDHPSNPFHSGWRARD
jgi:hypothetical protein